jgi:predicted permease
MTIRTFPMAQIGEEGPLVLLVLNSLAGLILLLACINVTNLLLARANERARETAVRLALGAPTGRLIMQSLWESVILCLAGGVLATALALWGLGAINAWARANLEGNLAFWWVWGFDRTVLLSAGGFVTLAIVVLGGVVARRAVNLQFNAVLQESGGARAGDRREGRIARWLVVVQVATVSVLLFFGCMSAIIAWRITRLDLGYDTHGLLSTRVDLPAERYADAGARGQFFQQLQQQLDARPELGGAVLRGTVADLASDEGAFELPDQPVTPVRPRTNVLTLLGPLAVMGIEVQEGRSFDSRDEEAGLPAVVVSRSMANRAWPGLSPLGRQLRLAGLGEAEPVRTVVGVVDDVLLGNPLARDRSTLAAYIPLRQSTATGTAIVFRHRAGRAEAQLAFYQSLAALDPLMAPDAVMSFDEVLAKSSLMARSVTRLFAGCFAFALLLAVSGTYGLMARSIGRRMREIGVRRALGATDRNILVMLLGQGGRQLGVGALAALPLITAIGAGFAHYFPVSLSLTLLTALLVTTTVTLVVLAATWVPTRKAVAVEPRDALWRE